jgi:hypothetical protein
MAPQSGPVTFDWGLVALAFRALHEPHWRYPFLDRLIRRRRHGGGRVGAAIVGRKVPRGQHIVVVRRGETELFKTLLREFRDLPHVQVIWDRRRRERRAKRAGEPKAERRQRDRRARPPEMWNVEGYLLARSES